MTTTRPTRRRAYHRGNVREDLLRTARSILATESVERITVRRLTAEIGVTPGNFYNHFASLVALLALLAAEGMEELYRRAVAVEKRYRRPDRIILAACREFVYFAAEKPQIYRLIFGNLVPGLRSDRRYLDAENRAFGNMVRLVYGDDRYDPADLPGSHLRCVHAYALFSLVNGLARNVIDGLVPFSSPEEIDRFTDSLVESLMKGRAYAELRQRFG